ncbi:MAG: GTP cyclohydrolase I FolE2 [Promethearchaeota archaeon]|nr:MAG: GTP cyclohydrolase I FolE2 [Candidatus Lokiarchaeota archaeon]
MPFKRDIQSEKPIASIPINKVGIRNVVRSIDFIRNDIKFSVNAEIEAYISLPGAQRGIHMSRTAESIEEVINNAAFEPASSFEEFCLRIVSLLLQEHEYTTHAEVEMNGVLFLKRKTTDRDQAQKSYNINSKAIANRNKEGDVTRFVYVGAQAEGITACPCAKEMSVEYSRELIKSRNKKLSDEEIDEILNVIPIASHNQRATGKIVIGSEITNGSDQLVDILDLVDVIENSMSGKIQSILKRPDEAELVRITHLNPRFVEDVVREAAKILSSPKFSQLADHCSINISADTQESIHHHDAYAELTTTMKKLRDKFE